MDTNTLNWELYLAPMAFAYNTSFHRTISSTPFKVTYGLDARTPDFEPRQLYGEDLPTELYQRMQACHNMAKKLAQESTEKAIDQYSKEHDKKLTPRTFKEGDRVLLKVKDFKLKNRKLCEEWKGPYTITKVFPNNTALIKTKFGKHETLYNFMMLKHYREDEVKKMARTREEAEKRAAKEPPKTEPPKRTYTKRTFEARADGGPVTRSATKANEKKNRGQNLIKKDADPSKSDADQAEISLIKKRLQKAKRTLEDIQKLNIKQWTSLKNSVEKETKVWKKCLVERKLEPQHLGPTFQCDNYGLPRLTPGIKQPVWVHNRRKFLQSLTFQERNIVLTGDPFVEFDPFTYILVYNYPEQIQNYPNIAQNFQHIVNDPPAPQSPAPPAPSPPPSSPASLSPEKGEKVLRGRTVETTPYKPKQRTWVQKKLAKVKSQVKFGKSKKPP